MSLFDKSYSLLLGIVSKIPNFVSLVLAESI